MSGNRPALRRQAKSAGLKSEREGNGTAEKHRCKPFVYGEDGEAARLLADEHQRSLARLSAISAELAGLVPRLDECRRHAFDLFIRLQDTDGVSRHEIGLVERQAKLAKMQLDHLAELLETVSLAG